MPRRGAVHRRRARGLILAALVPVLIAGCTAGPSTRPPVVEDDGAASPARQPATPGAPATPQPAPLPGLSEARDSLNWSDCTGETRQRLGPPALPGALRFSCARLTTSLDAPDLPQRGITRIAVLKVGEGPVPLAVVNDVDGEPGTLYAARLAAELPDELLDTFTLVGMDRRGTGQSDPARCIPDDVRRALLGSDPAGDITSVLDAARMAGQQCAISLEDEQGAFDSWRAAGDLDQLREQLGVPHLNALAHGEGSRVLAAYAVRYPARVGRAVLDGVPDPSADPVTVLDGVAGGAEATLKAFGEDCARRECPLGTDATSAVTALTERLRRSPLTTGDGLRLGPALALRAVLEGLARRDRWPELAEAIAAAGNGRGEPLAEFVTPLLTGDRLDPARLDGGLATRCNDTRARLPADRLGRASAELGGKHPVFGALLAQRLAWCSPWPSHSEPEPPPGAPGAPPILVLSTAADPVTPEQGTIRAAERMPSAVRVAWEGAGHGALSSSCVREKVTGFLVEGKVPRDGMLCPA
ncbi:TAP-like protein [Prauserella shujinwangii]|uniref:TAP-like protein n=1 Tax=Prauserella shujinwangii TaxID=1453103 RepID=A0A2T0M3K8_9PSEU|nr:alpha/beta hydrolase [Prauserella shujinwangii]PRX51328.1 TAP-like protein [Prauserella shujinwangii]